MYLFWWPRAAKARAALSWRARALGSRMPGSFRRASRYLFPSESEWSTSDQVPSAPDSGTLRLPAADEQPHDVAPAAGAEEVNGNE